MIDDVSLLRPGIKLEAILMLRESRQPGNADRNSNEITNERKPSETSYRRRKRESFKFHAAISAFGRRLHTGQHVDFVELAICKLFHVMSQPPGVRLATQHRVICIPHKVFTVKSKQVVH